MFAVSGGTIGYSIGSLAHGWPIKIAGGIIGFLLFAFVGHLLPVLLWHLLWFFVKKGWFLWPERLIEEAQQSHPPLALKDFELRRTALQAQEKKALLLLLVPGAFHFLSVIPVMFQRKKLHADFMSDGSFLLFGFLFYLSLGAFVFLRRWLPKKHGLRCPTCRQEIDGSSDCCRHCSTKIIER